MNISVFYRTDVFVGGLNEPDETVVNKLIEIAKTLPIAESAQLDFMIDTFDRYIAARFDLNYATSREITGVFFAALYPRVMSAIYPDNAIPDIDSEDFEDHITVYINKRDRSVFYQHWSQGDCGKTYFTID